MTDLLKAKMPANEICRNGKMRREQRSITCLRKPRKFAGPAVPASTKVVVPLRRPTSSASTPADVPPQ